MNFEKYQSDLDKISDEELLNAISLFSLELKLRMQKRANNIINQNRSKGGEHDRRP
jgi:hypothetical protein